MDKPKRTDRRVRAPYPVKARPLNCFDCGFPSVKLVQGPTGPHLVCRHCQRSSKS